MGLHTETYSAPLLRIILNFGIDIWYISFFSHFQYSQKSGGGGGRHLIYPPVPMIQDRQQR
jgi:hypothetical protein